VSVKNTSNENKNNFEKKDPCNSWEKILTSELPTTKKTELDPPSQWWIDFPDDQRNEREIILNWTSSMTTTEHPQKEMTTTTKQLSLHETTTPQNEKKDTKDRKKWNWLKNQGGGGGFEKKKNDPTPQMMKKEPPHRKTNEKNWNQTTEKPPTKKMKPFDEMTPEKTTEPENKKDGEKKAKSNWKRHMLPTVTDPMPPLKMTTKLLTEIPKKKKKKDRNKMEKPPRKNLTWEMKQRNPEPMTLFLKKGKIINWMWKKN